MNKVCGLFDLIVIFSVSLEVFVPTVLDILLELVSVLYEHFNIFTLFKFPNGKLLFYQVLLCLESSEIILREYFIPLKFLSI